MTPWREKTSGFRVALVLGGARSGKSRYALSLAAALPPPHLFVATGEAGDAEMAARIEDHRRERGPGWDTVDAPLALAEALAAAQGRYGVILVDCLTLWLSNRMLTANASAADVESACRDLVAVLEEAATPTILVSNEVGLGIVPENHLAREFRDRLGWLHQQLARAADLVVLMVAGQPLMVKS
jgi:adenosylcobinamide kinase/adenosylcobinamide-phosphate guanylyltransferase